MGEGGNSKAPTMSTIASPLHGPTAVLVVVMALDIVLGALQGVLDNSRLVGFSVGFAVATYSDKTVVALRLRGPSP